MEMKENKFIIFGLIFITLPFLFPIYLLVFLFIPLIKEIERS